ncbi:MAG: hypothetical protein GY754_13905 [bacterium]|nr:hypothetical protein [bacterium]
MKKYLFIFLLSFSFILPVLSFGHGYSVSELKEVIHKFEGIYIVKITTMKKTERDGGEGGSTIKISFLLKEVLKGKKIDFKEAVYTLPAISSDFGGIKMKMWIKIDGSGTETKMKKGEQYIIYFTKNRLQRYKRIYNFDRADPVSRKKEVLKLLILRE